MSREEVERYFSSAGGDIRAHDSRSAGCACDWCSGRSRTARHADWIAGRAGDVTVDHELGVARHHTEKLAGSVAAGRGRSRRAKVKMFANTEMRSMVVSLHFTVILKSVPTGGARVGEHSTTAVSPPLKLAFDV
jgi:hypothetical protein